MQRIPYNLLKSKRVTGKGVQKKAWWMAFTEKSRWRLDVEKGLAKKAERMTRKRERARKKMEKEAERALSDAKKREKLFRTIMIVGGVLIAAVVLLGLLLRL